MNKMLTQVIILIVFWIFMITAFFNGNIPMVILSVLVFCLNILFILFYYDLFK